MKIEPLDGPFGVRITGLDLSRPLDDSTAAALLSAFYDNQFMVIPRQTLSVGEFTGFCAWFGRPKHHLLDHLRLPGFPQVLTLSNMLRDGKPMGVFEGGSFWHTDVAYEEPPNSSTIVYSVKAPTPRVSLAIAGMFQAYDALPQRTKDKIDGLIAIHHYGNRDDMDENSPYSAEKLTEAQKKKITNVDQPIVRAHPVTGRKALYGIAGSSFGIRGMAESEAIKLLDELKHHATQPQFVLHHPYDLDEVAAWDTFSTLHKAPLTRISQGGDDGRLLWRISVTGRRMTKPGVLQ